VVNFSFSRKNGFGIYENSLFFVPETEEEEGQELHYYLRFSSDTRSHLPPQELKSALNQKVYFPFEGDGHAQKAKALHGKWHPQNKSSNLP